MTRSTNPGAGRPVIERPIKNVVGLMRQLLDNEVGANIRVAEEIEAMTLRSLVPTIESKASEADTRQQISKRISEFAAGSKPIPHWFEQAAREWCVQKVMHALAKRQVELAIDGKNVGLARGPATRVLADGLVGLVLHHIAEGQEKKTAACLRLIDNWKKAEI